MPGEGRPTGKTGAPASVGRDPAFQPVWLCRVATRSLRAPSQGTETTGRQCRPSTPCSLSTSTASCDSSCDSWSLSSFRGVSAPVESGADATVARASGASRRVLPQGMCKPACKQCAAQRVMGGPPPRVHRCEGRSGGERIVIWRHAGDVGLSVRASATRDCITRWRDAARAHVKRREVTRGCPRGRWPSLTRARQRRNFPDSFYIYRGKLHSRADDPAKRRRASARLSVPIGAPRSCPQRGHPALYRGSV